MNKKFKISITVIILLIIGVCTFNLLTTDTKTGVGVFDESVYYSQGKYIYMTYNGVYSMSDGSSEKLFEADECYSLFVQDEEIYLTYYENNNVNPKIAILDLNGNVLKTAQLKLEQHFTDYKNPVAIKAVIDNVIFVFDDRNGVSYALDADENFELKTIEFKDNYSIDNGYEVGTYNNHLFLYYYSDGKLIIKVIVDKENSRYYPFFGFDSQSFSNDIIFEWDIAFLTDLTTYDINNKTAKEYEDFFDDTKTHGNQIKNIVSYDDMLLLTTNSNSRIDSSDDFNEHDVLCVVDTKNLSVEKEFKTKRFEHIIYADKEIAITYRNGRYTTYSLDNWKKIESRPAEKIEKGSSYAFEACGDYIFVFSGELVDIIEIP